MAIIRRIIWFSTQNFPTKWYFKCSWLPCVRKMPPWIYSGISLKYSLEESLTHRVSLDNTIWVCWGLSTWLSGSSLLPVSVHGLSFNVYASLMSLCIFRFIFVLRTAVDLNYSPLQQPHFSLTLSPIQSQHRYWELEHQRMNLVYGMQCSPQQYLSSRLISKNSYWEKTKIRPY